MSLALIALLLLSGQPVTTTDCGVATHRAQIEESRLSVTKAVSVEPTMGVPQAAPDSLDELVIQPSRVANRATQLHTSGEAAVASAGNIGLSLAGESVFGGLSGVMGGIGGVLDPLGDCAKSKPQAPPPPDNHFPWASMNF